MVNIFWAFYLFPKSPIEDDVAFVKALQKELILTVPGQGFLYPGYFRIAFCVDDETIVNALPGFKRVMDQYKQKIALGVDGIAKGLMQRHSGEGDCVAIDAVYGNSDAVFFVGMTIKAKS